MIQHVAIESGWPGEELRCLSREPRLSSRASNPPLPCQIRNWFAGSFIVLDEGPMDLDMFH